MKEGVFMAKISMLDEDIVVIPKNVSVAKTGYVYYNVSTFWVKENDNHSGRADHKKVCIGKIVSSKENWKNDRRMFPNTNYFKFFDTDKLPDQPQKADNISIGILTVVETLISSSGLLDVLSEVFSEEEISLILDLAMYMLSQESAVFQHFPHWGRNHALFSSKIHSDSFISEFEKNNISVSKINLFKSKWAANVIGNGRLYFCYDSTNINSQAEGVFLVEKGHAKDDPSLCQVNMDYVIRQEDGLPVTFTTFPGSINDMAEASEMISFFESLLSGTDKSEIQPDITMICDRGYISEENVKSLDSAGMQFLLMLRANMRITNDLLLKYAKQVKSSANYIREYEQYAMTVPEYLFDSDKEKRFFHIIWDHTLERKHRNKLYNDLDNKENRIKNSIERKKVYTKDELKVFEKWFTLEIEKSGELTVKKKGGGKGKKKVDGFIIKKATKNTAAIDADLEKCGFYILVTSEKMADAETIEAYLKRDCVEKVFRALKSFLGMDKIGTYSDDSIHAKTLIWFVAAILHSLIFNNTKHLRITDKKSYTVPAVVDYLEEICADKNLNTLKYERRYKTTAKQNKILKALGVNISDIDKRISLL